MKTYTNKYFQFELFPTKANQHSDKPRSKIRFTNIQLSLENMVVLGIVIIMSMVVSFSLGVKRGRIANRGQDTPQKPVFQAQPVSASEPAPLQSSDSAPDERGLAVLEKNGTIDQSVEVLTIVEAGLSLPINEEPPVMAPFVNSSRTADRVYTIQVASFKKEKHAQKEAMNLKEKGYEIRVMSKGSYSIVCVGKFSHKDEAKKFSKKLKKKYKDCLIRRL
ncbi:MAG: SPOR domain-containing protein [Candidatus Omnitrophica bacterium]|nr:SPOR domain-containing protein [Candidatus Omnitrophota bacterium]